MLGPQSLATQNVLDQALRPRINTDTSLLHHQSHNGRRVVTVNTLTIHRNNVRPTAGLLSLCFWFSRVAGKFAYGLHKFEERRKKGIHFLFGPSVRVGLSVFG